MSGNCPDRPSSFIAWGKLRVIDGGHQLHPLIDHMLDVAACFVALSQCTAVHRAMQRLAGRPLNPIDIERLAVLVFLHDVGKANAGFQVKRWSNSENVPRGWPVPAGHGAEGWALFTGGVAHADSLLAALRIPEMASWGAGVFDLLHASISHHGRPVMESPSIPAAIWRPVRDAAGAVIYDPLMTLTCIGDVMRGHFPIAFQPNVELPTNPAFSHLIAGLVQLADWLGSDTRFFPFSEQGEDRAATARQLADRAVRAIGLDATASRTSLCNHPSSFEDVFRVPAPRPMQLEAASDALGPLVILEAETGSGKTEAALWRFNTLFRSGAVDSLYFALPTRVAASQLYARLQEFVARMWVTDAPVVVRALPGYESADGQEKIALPEYKVLWVDRPDDAVAHRRWVAETPKRFLAATIAIGTIDQALLGALKVRHAHMRHALLTRSLLVVDEVHASDAYMTVLLQQLLRAQLSAGGHALLLSATLGAVARTRFLSVGAKGEDVGIAPLAQASVLEYPAISTRVGPQVLLTGVDGNPRTKKLHWRTVDGMDDPAAVAKLAVDAANQGAHVLVVRNTVRAALATLSEVELLAPMCGTDILFRVNGISTLHHSRFSRQDRPLLDAAVERQIGKRRGKMGGSVIVGTQTLEQSLDIDADLLITDLCPMDVLLQRIGRLHRHNRPENERPAGFRRASAWILTPPSHDVAPLLKRARNGLGRFRDGGGVYPDLRIVEATRRLVDERPWRDLPAENRALVERATHPDALHELEVSLGSEWQALGLAIEGDTGARRGLGHLHALPFDDAFGDVCFPDGSEKIATRLGAADLLVEFDPPRPGPFGQDVKQLALRHFLAPDVSKADAIPCEVEDLPGRGGFEFTLGGGRYRYSRLGLERLRSDTDQR